METFNYCFQILNKQLKINVCEVIVHAGISGNEVADMAAKHGSCK